MTVLISGASGLIGSALMDHFTSYGHIVKRLVRKSVAGSGTDISWDPEQNIIDASLLEGTDVVIHLAGENISEGRWTKKKKTRIHNSRVLGTRFLSTTIANLKQPPSVFLSASAIGFYGNRHDEILTEESGSGIGFIAEVCHEWEEAVRPAEQAGTRVVTLRTGVILTSSGGALAKMLPVFRMGVGVKIGNGRQYFSWISLDDCISAIDYMVRDNSISGPVNLVSPNPVTNAEFTKTLGKVLHRPTMFSAPAFITRAMFGEMADELLLASQRAIPEKLTNKGFTFRYPRLEDALQHVLKVK